MIELFIIFMYFIFALFVTFPIWGVLLLLLIFRPKNKKEIVKTEKLILFDDNSDSKGVKKIIRYDDVKLKNKFNEFKSDSKDVERIIHYDDVTGKCETKLDDNENFVISDNIGYVLDIYGICAGIMFFAYRMSIERTGNSYTNGSFTDLLLFLGVVPIFVIYTLIRVNQYSKIKELSERLYLILLIFVFCIFVPGYPKILWILPLILVADFITKNKNGIVFIISCVLFVGYLFFGKINPTWHLFDKEDFVISQSKYEEILQKEKEREDRLAEKDRELSVAGQSEKQKEEVQKKKIEIAKQTKERLKYFLNNPDKFGYKFDINDTNFEFGGASFTISYNGLKTDTIFVDNVLENKQVIKSYSYIRDMKPFSFLDEYENSKDDIFVREIFNKFIAGYVDDTFRRKNDDLGIKFMDIKFKHSKEDVSELIIEYVNNNSSEPWDKKELLSKMIKRNYLKYFQEVPGNMKLKVTFVDENKKKASFLTTMDANGAYINELD